MPPKKATDDEWETTLSRARETPDGLSALADRKVWEDRIVDLLERIPEVTTSHQRMAAAHVVMSSGHLPDRTGLDMNRILELVGRWINSGTATMRQEANVQTELRVFSDAGISVGDRALIPTSYIRAVIDACQNCVENPTEGQPSLAHACFGQLGAVTWTVHSFLAWSIHPASFAAEFWGAPANTELWAPVQIMVYVELVQFGILPEVAAGAAGDEMGALMLTHELMSEIARRIVDNALSEDASSLDARAMFHMKKNQHVLCASSINSLCTAQEKIRGLGVQMTVREVYAELVENTWRALILHGSVRSSTRDSCGGEYPDDSRKRAQQLVIEGSTSGARPQILEVLKPTGVMDKVRSWPLPRGEGVGEKIMEAYPPPEGTTSWIHTSTRGHALSILAEIDDNVWERGDFGRTKSFFLAPVRNRADIELQMDLANARYSAGAFPLPSDVTELVSFIYHLDSRGNCLDLSGDSPASVDLWQSVVAASRAKGRFTKHEEQQRIDELCYDSVYGPVATRPFDNARQLRLGGSAGEMVMQLAIKKPEFAERVSLQLAAAIVWETD